MALGRQGERQSELMVPWREVPRSPGHIFYDRLQQVVVEAGFDAFAEATCKPYHAAKIGVPSIPPSRCFRTHMVGYFEGMDCGRGIEWRFADSLSLRAFLRVETIARVPDRSWLSKTRSRLPVEVGEHVFSCVLKLIAKRGLVSGAPIGVDASTMESNAALRKVVRRETGEGYVEMLERMAKNTGIDTPRAANRIRLDRARKGRMLSNADCMSPTDPEKIAKMKNGNTNLACKPEHAAYLDTGTVVAAEIRIADSDQRTMLKGALQAVEINLGLLGMALSAAQPAAEVADNRYHSCAILMDLDGGVRKAGTSSPRRKDFSGWHGDGAAPRAVYAKGGRLRSEVGRAAMRRRGVIDERSFAHTLDCALLRRAWLRGGESVQERARALRGRGLRPEPWVPRAPVDRRRHTQGGRPPQAAGCFSSLCAPTKHGCCFFSPSTKAASHPRGHRHRPANVARRAHRYEADKPFPEIYVKQSVPCPDKQTRDGGAYD